MQRRLFGQEKARAILCSGGAGERPPVEVMSELGICLMKKV